MSPSAREDVMRTRHSSGVAALACAALACAALAVAAVVAACGAQGQAHVISVTPTTGAQSGKPTGPGTPVSGVPQTSYVPADGYAESLLAANGVTYAGSSTGAVYALNASGAPLWHADLGGSAVCTGRTHRPSTRSPAPRAPRRSPRSPPRPARSSGGASSRPTCWTPCWRATRSTSP